MHDVVVNLLASLVTGVTVWVAQRLLHYRKVARQQAFFGVGRNAECQLAVSRHHASAHLLSVHRHDVAALVELATIARDCGGRADLITEDVTDGVGRLTEFCVGGPDTNPRTAAHLRSILRGVRIGPYDAKRKDQPVSVGSTTFHREPNRAEYVVLARAWAPAGGRPVFVVCGQTARANLAAARFLAAHHRQLYRRYGASRRFCLVLRVVEPVVYGSDFTEVAADVSGDAFGQPEPAPPGKPD